MNCPLTSAPSGSRVPSLQRYGAVREVLDDASVTEVARRFGVSRQSVHNWLNAYRDGRAGRSVAAAALLR